jgi:hypothetical protein
MSTTIALDNSAFFPVYNGNVEGAPPDRVMAANAAYDTNALNQELTTYATGVSDGENLEALINAMASPVPVGSEAFNYLVHNERNAFMDDYADNGDMVAEGGDPAKVKTKGTRVDGSVDNKALCVVLMNSRGGNNPTVQQTWVRHLKNRLMRTEVLRAFALLDGASVNDAKEWGPLDPAADPDVDVAEDLDLGGDARGVDANTIIYGGGAWLKRFRSFRTGENAGRFASSMMTVEQLRDLFGVDDVIKAKARRQATAAAKGKILNDVVYSFYNSKSPTQEDPSNLKRFIYTGSGGQMMVFVEEKPMRTVITVWHQSRIVLTSNLGIRKATVSFSPAE